MNIRESTNDDLDLIYRVHEDAFGESEGKVIAQLACDILADESAQPLLSLVAENDDDLTGNIIFSSVKLVGNAGCSVYILAPLAVSTASQHKGTGTNLIHQGLDILKQRGSDIVLVLGDPNYYNRAGFKAGHDIDPPHKLAYPEAWMAIELKPGMLAKTRGIAQCANTLNSPEHW